MRFVSPEISAPGKFRVLRSDDRGLAVRVPFNNGGRLMRGMIVATVFNGIVDSGNDTGIDLVKKGGGRISADVGGRGNDRFTISFDEMPAKGFTDEPDGDGAIGIDEIIGQTYGAFINHRGWLYHRLQVVENAEVGLCGIPEDIPFLGHKDDQAFCSCPLFEIINLCNGSRVGSIAAKSPDGIGGIQDEPAG